MSRRTMTPELLEKVFELREGGAYLHEIDAPLGLCLAAIRARGAA